MTRLARLCAVAAIAFTLAACGGGEGPTQPDIDREPAGNGSGLEEEQGPAEDTAPEPQPGQSPIDDPDDPQPGTTD